MKKTIGILGGMGAAASLRLAQHIVATAQLKSPRSDADFPEFVLYNMTTAGLDEEGFNEKNSLAVRDAVLVGIFKLSQIGCDIVVVACNTVHCFYDEMSKTPGVTVINMIDAACAEVNGSKAVGVLASQTTKASGLYANALGARGIAVIAPKANEQKVLNRAISDVIAGLTSGKDSAAIAEVASSLKDRGAEKIIIGCTELPLAMDLFRIPVPVIDAGLAAIDRAMKLL